MECFLRHVDEYFASSEVSMKHVLYLEIFNWITILK